MEKSSRLLMTEDDYDQYAKGQLSERLKRNWGFTSFQELDEKIKSGEVEVVFTHQT